MCVCVFRVAIRNQPLTSSLQRANIKNDIPFENICTLNAMPGHLCISLCRKKMSQLLNWIQLIEFQRKNMHLAEVQ